MLYINRYKLMYLAFLSFRFHNAPLGIQNNILIFLGEFSFLAIFDVQTVIERDVLKPLHSLSNDDVLLYSFQLFLYIQ